MSDNEVFKNSLNYIVVGIAMGEIYVHENEGDLNNERILMYARELGLNEYISDEQSWCALFINWVLMKAGAIHFKTLIARDLQNLPYRVLPDMAMPGDIVILWRESPGSWKGHVGIYLNRNEINGNYRLVGGNQSNMVKIQEFSEDRILHIRRPMIAPDSIYQLHHCIACGETYYTCKCWHQLWKFGD